MLNSIVGRNRMAPPLSDTEIRIIQSAVKLFLQNGFSRTTIKMIADDTGIRPGNINYYFHTKEDMLYLLVQELMDFHMDVLEETLEKSHDVLFSYALEVAMQITICDADKKAWDLYYSAYTLSGTYFLIKDLAAAKNYKLFHSRLPEWTSDDFRAKENIASAIEFSALTSPCDAHFTPQYKLRLILDSLFRLYDVAKDEREAVIQKILELDLLRISQDVFEKFINSAGLIPEKER